jgi:hypothetical protein
MGARRGCQHQLSRSLGARSHFFGSHANRIEASYPRYIMSNSFLIMCFKMYVWVDARLNVREARTPQRYSSRNLEHRAGFGVAGLKGRAMTSTQKDARRLALVLIGERKGSDRRGCG